MFTLHGNSSLFHLRYCSYFQGGVITQETCLVDELDNNPIS